MEYISYLTASLIVLLMGMVFTSFIKNKSVSGIVSLIITSFFSGFILCFSLKLILKNTVSEYEFFSLSPLLNSSFQVFVDSLSALFLIIIAIVAFCVTMFSWKYLNAYKIYSAYRFYPFLFLLFISSVGIVIIRDLLFFIFFWELMTLSSWLLVISEREKREALKGGLQYFIATHVATAFLILASVILYSYSNNFSFIEIRKELSILTENNVLLFNFICLLIFIAFVTKAGVLPFGFWLPNTYPQAPSSASSFFGGVMSKLAVYALFRFFLSVIPFSSNTQIWGFIIATSGVFSIFVGTIAALTQDEAKRLMSFHAIGQVGYMLLGIGIGLYFINTNPFLGMIALAGGLLHVFNNSIYKSLLFLNAGAIFYKTATTDLNKVSGLIKVMPLTTMTAIVGSLSIAGVPPFNGFVSKLLIFEFSIWTAKISNASFLIKGIFIISGIISVFISAITLASFLKFVNASFMGKLKALRNDKKDIPWTMTIAQIILAILCLITGLFPIIPLELIYNAILSVSEISLPAFSEIFISNFAGIGINFCPNCLYGGAWFPIFVIFSVLIFSLIIFAFEKYAQAPKRDVDTWYGGKEHTPEEVTYTGHSFYQPFKELVSFKVGKIKFRGLYPSEFLSFKVSIPLWIKKIINPDEWLYYPVANKIEKLFNLIEKLYDRLIQHYTFLFIIGIVLVILLVFYLLGG